MENRTSIFQYTSIFYAVFTILGYSYISRYYKSFGIDIYPYLDLSEILLSFLNIINSSISLIFLLFLLFVSNFFPEIFYDITKLKVSEEIEKISKKVNLVFTLIGLAVLLFKDGINKPLTNFYLLTLGTVFIFFIGFHFFKGKVFMSKYSDVSKIAVYFVLFGVIFFINKGYSDYKVELIKKKIETSKIAFDYDSRKTKSNDSIIYIGSTNKYIFLHNLKSNDNFIYEKSNIKNLIFKQY